MARGHRKRRGHGAEHENDERWLLTYADMITLLMALFMVLFSISSVNISKYKTLQLALKAAFSGDILPGGKSIAQPGASANSSRAPTSVDTPAIVRLTPNVTSELEHVPSSRSSSANVNSSQSSTSSVQLSAAQQEQSNFEALEHELNAYAAKHGFAHSVHTAIERRGLVVRVLTDSLLFSSGQRHPRQPGPATAERGRGTAERRSCPPDQCRGQHRQRADQRPLPEQLGALHRPRGLRRALPDRQRGRPSAAQRDRLRR